MELKKTNIGCFMAVPDLISLLNLSFGFLAILMAINNQIVISATFIIIALIFDSLDGWVARKLSRVDNHGFGKNIDSLSDIVSFGVAPGILLYCSGKIYMEILGLSSQIHYLDYLLAIISLFVVICGVLRLTRFNVIAEKIDFNGFIGIPIPTAGIILASFILTGFF
ncbi:CDP-diacylglycerol--serine O-phosphatidyltransferase [Methanobrevibacter arboriphilus]|nr:CDP-diacylglycerol--serine O-phosphatidyltransferase [Methanobrevibacter arboriphilus]